MDTFKKINKKIKSVCIYIRKKKYFDIHVLLFPELWYTHMLRLRGVFRNTPKKVSDGGKPVGVNYTMKQALLLVLWRMHMEDT